MASNRKKKNFNKYFGISLDIVSLEDVFDNMLYPPVVINDIVDYDSFQNTVDRINSVTKTVHDKEEIETSPSCRYGCTRGRYNYDPDEPVICPVCETPVTSVLDDPIVPDVWMRVPDGVDAFIHPRIYSIMSNVLKFDGGRFNLLEWMTSPTYTIKKSKRKIVNTPPHVRMIEAFKEKGFERGINYFHRNFDEIIEFVLVDCARIGWDKNKLGLVKSLYEFIHHYRECVFTQYLPFPPRQFMSCEQNGKTEYVDPNLKDAFDAPKIIADIETSSLPMSKKVLQSESMKVVRRMCSFFETYYSDTCHRKGGMLRGQLGRTRSSYTARAVIAPLAMAHCYDELHIPYGVAVSLFTVHIENKMLKRGYTPREILSRIDQGTLSFDDEIYEIMMEIISECPEGGYPCAMLRNPTLVKLSNQYFRITDIHRDIHNYAIMISVLMTKAPNGDFDGDQLQLKLLVDNKQKEAYSRLRAHLGMMSTRHPNEVASHITFHPEIITLVNNQLQYYRDMKEAS